MRSQRSSGTRKLSIPKQHQLQNQPQPLLQVQRAQLRSSFQLSSLHGEAWLKAPGPGKLVFLFQSMKTNWLWEAETRVKILKGCWQETQLCLSAANYTSFVPTSIPSYNLCQAALWWKLEAENCTKNIVLHVLDREINKATETQADALQNAASNSFHNFLRKQANKSLPPSRKSP